MPKFGHKVVKSVREHASYTSDDGKKAAAEGLLKIVVMVEMTGLAKFAWPETPSHSLFAELTSTSASRNSNSECCWKIVGVFVGLLNIRFRQCIQEYRR